MQLIITDAWLAKSRAVHLSGSRLIAFTLMASLLLMLTSLGMYHWVFLKGAREGWPVVGAFLRLVVKDEFEQRDKFMRENLDVLARKLGEVQAKLTQLESLGDRVSGLAGINSAEFKVKSGQGGALITGRPLTLDEIQTTLSELEVLTGQRTDLLTVMESRLFDLKIKNMMVPTRQPLANVNLGSIFGWRIDPISGTSALHTGLDYQADVGTPIYSAAGGLVVAQEFHLAYGNMVEVDHGNELITRYAHASKIFVKKGDLIKRGQKIAEVGTSGRSTGPHLHFEVLVRGIPQDPQKFLTAGSKLPIPAQAVVPSLLPPNVAIAPVNKVANPLLGQR